MLLCLASVSVCLSMLMGVKPLTLKPCILTPTRLTQSSKLDFTAMLYLLGKLKDIAVLTLNGNPLCQVHKGLGSGA